MYQEQCNIAESKSNDALAGINYPITTADAHEAVVLAKKYGYHKWLEDISYCSLSAIFEFTVEIEGSDLVRYINFRIRMEPLECLYLKQWVYELIKYGINTEKLIPSISKSNLSDFMKINLINYTKEAIVKAVIA